MDPFTVKVVDFVVRLLVVVVVSWAYIVIMCLAGTIFVDFVIRFAMFSQRQRSKRTRQWFANRKAVD
ncbi:MAG TPA: hypothetical protein VHQ20_02615 [Patescibacteria group bacterium]|jgi:hypothetical protein|nr:hypothetical protein [Patescibacteria group bacterium]